MPRNLELKATLSSLPEGLSCANRSGARFVETLRQEDTYFRVSSGRLKLRRDPVNGDELVFYERAEAGGDRLCLFQKECVSANSLLGSMLRQALGEVVVVRKTRHLFMLRGARIHLDDVEELGAFLEFEVPAEDLGKAKEILGDLVARFGIREDRLLQGSYADLLLRKRGA